MATAPYDADRHHVGLGEDADSLIGLLLEGGFRCSLQPAPAPSAFGSGLDYLNNPALARWTQDDFSGGAFNYLWGEDTAMFSYCTSMLPVLLSQTIRTVPPILSSYAVNDTSDILLSFVRGETLWFVRPTEIQTYDTQTETWTSTATPSSTPVTAAAYDQGAEMLYLCTNVVYVLTVPALQAPGRTATATITIAAPGVVTVTAHGLSVNDVVFFTTTGELPTGLTENSLYYVKEVVDADSFKLAAKKVDTNSPEGRGFNEDGTSDDNKAITTTGSQSGDHTAYLRLESEDVGTIPQRPQFDFADTDSFASVDVLANGRAFMAAVCDGNRLYTLSIPASRAGAPVWTENTRLPGPWRDFAVYNGAIYILCADGYNNTSLYSFDGANIVPITDFPYNFEGMCIQVYAGRIYVGGAGRDIAGSRSYAELYEVTGATLRLVRTFTPEVRDGGEVTPFSDATSLQAMGVFEGLLYLGFDNYGFVVYDVTTDSLFGGSQFQDVVPGAEILKVLTANQTLNCWVNSTSVAKRGLYRIASIGETVDPYEGVLVTSDFGPEPASDKRWSELKVVSRYGEVAVEYSTDGGVTYVSLDTEQTTEGNYIYTVCDLSALEVTKRIRFRFTMAADENSDSYTEFIGFTLGFLFLSTGKRTWTFSVNATARVQGKDTSTEVQDPAAILSALQGWAADRQPLVYRDVDGTDKRVSITRFEDFKPVVGLPLDSSRGLEGFYALTLTEV